MPDPCSCNTWLTRYDIHWVAKPEAYVNADYIRRTGAMIEVPDRRHNILTNNLIEDTTEIEAFTWAEAQRYLEFKNGDDDRKPLHRLIVNGVVWQECQVKPQLEWMFAKS